MVEEEVLRREEGNQTGPRPDPRLIHLKSVLTDPLQLQTTSLKLGWIDDGQPRSDQEIARIVGISEAEVIVNITLGVLTIKNYLKPEDQT